MTSIRRIATSNVPAISGAAGPASTTTSKLVHPDVGSAPLGAAPSPALTRPSGAQALALQAKGPLDDPSLAALFPRLSDIPAQFRIDPKDNPPVFLVDGKVERFAGPSTPVYSKIAVQGPGGLQPLLLGHEPQLGEAEAKRAIAAAEKAWDSGLGAWPTATTEARIAAVAKFVDALEAMTERIATLLMFEIGKEYSVAKGEVTRTVQYLRDTLAELRAMEAEAKAGVTAKNGSTDHYGLIQRAPFGKVLCVAPFNYPVNEFLTTLIPAVLMGNVAIAKTARFGQLSTMAMCEALAQAFPPGVISILPGDGKAVIPPLMSSAATDPSGKPVQGAIDVFAFIGSEGAANAIMAQHKTPATLERVLGLGAKNPAVILDGADLEAVSTKLVKGSLGFNGQRCTAEKVIFVPRQHAAKFAQLYADKVAKLKVGMPWDGAAITPLPEDGKLEWMRGYIEDALAKGAQIVNPKGGTGHHSIMRPAVLFPVDASMKIYREEQFGPIVPIVPYDDVREIVEWQRASPYRQQAGLWGPNDQVAALAPTFARFVSRVNLNDNCQRGPDAFPFSASGRSGAGTLSLRDALIALSRPVIVQSPDAGLLAQATS